MRPKEMKDLAAFSAREEKRAAAEERDEYWGERLEREGRIEESVGGQNPGPEAPTRGRKGRERKEQRRCQERSNCQRSDGEG